MIGNKLEPFKFWCQKVLPNVYDDSLSYYEYLCKLNEYLNEVIGQINTLTDNMEDYEADLTATWLETKSYIDNYFNNLDVQQEINNKLDQMASSGALSTLLAPIVGTQIGGVVAQQIGGTVAQQINGAVAQQIDGSVAGQMSSVASPIITNWLNKNVNPVGSAVVVDESLTISGAAADAQVTGTKIDNNYNDLNNLIDNGYSTLRTQYIHGRIAGAPGQIFNNSYVWRATTGIKFNNNCTAIINIPSGTGVTLWRCTTSDVETGTKIQVGTYTQTSNVSVTTEYWYVICAYVDTDPDGSLHQTLSQAKLTQISMMYIDESGYYENRIDNNDGDIKQIKYQITNLNNELITPYINFVHGRIAGAGTFFNNPYSYRNNDGLYLKKGSKLIFDFSTNNNLNIYGYDDSSHTTINNIFNVTETNVREYNTVYDGYYHFCIENKVNPGSAMVTDAELNAFKIVVYPPTNYMIETLTNKYGTTFVDEENALIEKVAQIKNKNVLVFAVCTDIHGTNYPMNYSLPDGATPSGSKGYYRYKEFADLFVKIAEENGVDFISNLGDTIASVYDESHNDYNHEENKKRFNALTRRLSDTHIPYLYTIGHHEMYRFGDDGLSKNELIGLSSKYNRNLKAIYNTNDNDCCYYYVDLESPYPNVRIISLDVCCDNTGNTYSLQQIGWLENVALDTSKPVIILSHMATGSSDSGMDIAHGDDVATILNNFVLNGGKVLAFIHGHTHVDNIISPTVSGNKYVDITTACAWCLKATPSSHLIGDPQSWDRKYNTYTEYLADIYCIDCVTGIIKIFRFGAGEDRQYIPS